MKDLQEIELKAIAAAWANECGGKLAMVFQAELDGLKVGKKWETDQRLFSATKDLFLAHGESEIKHLAWRQKEMLLLCLEVTRQLTKEINPGHALFRTENKENDGPSADEDLRMPPLIEPPYTRSELEKEVTSWYLRTKRDTSFKLPEEAYIENAIKDLPASLLYLKWEFTIGTWSQLNLKTTSHSTTSKQKPQAINQANTKWKTGFQIPVGGKHKEDGHLPESVQYYRWKRCNDDAKIMGESAQLNTSPKTKDDTKNWWIVKWEDLDSTDLNKAEVIQKILHWINEDKEMTDEAKGDMQVNLESALGSAQRRTSERHSAGNPLPLRISRRSKYKLERLAMIDPGFQGGDSAKYRLIKNSRLN